MNLRDQLIQRLTMAQGDVPAQVAEQRVAEAIAEYGRDTPMVVLGETDVAQAG